MWVPRRVLVVDDDAEIQEILALLLGDAGYEVISARDGAAALALLRRDPRGWVVLLDWMMPVMDGQATLEAIASDDDVQCCTSIILMTAGARTLSLPLVRLLGQLDVGYLAKPFDLDSLLELVDDAYARVAQAVERCSQHGEDTRREPASVAAQTPRIQSWLPAADLRE
jgi:CheY-like chemotaxis protein